MGGKFGVWRATVQRRIDNENLFFWFPYEEGNSELGLENEANFCNRFHFLARIGSYFLGMWYL